MSRLISDRGLNRRAFLRATRGLAVLAPTLGITGGLLAGCSGPRRVERIAIEPGMAFLREPDRPATPIWGYQAQVPGPVLRYRQGEFLDIDFVNRLTEPSSVHWHGLRLPNAMDGVAHITQPPIAAGGSFRYSFQLKDAGSYWYHPHFNSAEQVDRGLSGALIVEEPEPPLVDREWVWLLDDWRLDDAGRPIADYDDPTQRAAEGRLGDLVTINGAPPGAHEVRAGERIRLRLINAANARIFALSFAGHVPQIIAYDGQPVAPHAPDDGKILLAPSQRVDLMLDLTGEPGGHHDILSQFETQAAISLGALVYRNETPLRDAPLSAPIALPANPLGEPDLTDPLEISVNFQRDGAAMLWTVNGVAHLGHDAPPLFEVASGRTVAMHLHNDSDFLHPIHLHGFPFRILERGFAPNPRQEWRDTVLIGRREAVEIAFVAEAPGDWMIHCHILEHQAAGMMHRFRVA